MAGLELILKKLDQISNRLDLLEKKIEQRDRTVPAPSVSQQNPHDWKISSELLNQKKTHSDWETNIDDYILSYQNDVGTLQGRIRRHQDDVQELRGKTVELFKFGHLLREKILELDRKDLPPQKQKKQDRKKTTGG
jgi:hypothetical protein|tara:strand:+ start:795 stop:1202 length:408 start_codon:yes stop_codon:yes gene_type:complete